MMATWSSKALTVLLSSESCMFVLFVGLLVGFLFGWFLVVFFICLFIYIVFFINTTKAWSSKALTVLLSSESCMKRVSYCSNPFVSVREGGAFKEYFVKFKFKQHKITTTATTITTRGCRTAQTPLYLLGRVAPSQEHLLTTTTTTTTTTTILKLLLALPLQLLT